MDIRSDGWEADDKAGLEAQVCISCLQTLRNFKWKKYFLFSYNMCALGKKWKGLSSQDFICKPKSHFQTHQTFESVFLLLVCLLTYIMRGPVSC